MKNSRDLIHVEAIYIAIIYRIPDFLLYLFNVDNFLLLITLLMKPRIDDSLISLMSLMSSISYVWFITRADAELRRILLIGHEDSTLLIKAGHTHAQKISVDRFSKKLLPAR